MSRDRSEVDIANESLKIIFLSLHLIFIH